jgi:hypothetical protein
MMFQNVYSTVHIAHPLLDMYKHMAASHFRAWKTFVPLPFSSVR